MKNSRKAKTIQQLKLPIVRELRLRLPDLQKLWKPMWVSDGANGVYRIDRGVGDTPLFIDVNQVPAEMREPLHAVLYHLGEQARMARVALEIAKVELGASTGRSEGGKKGTRARAAEAKDRLAKLQAEAAKLRRMEPGIKKEAAAAMLADRFGGGKEAITKLLRAAPKKSLESK